MKVKAAVWAGADAAHGRGRVTGQALVEHPGVDKIAFTGSTEVGRTLMRQSAEHIQKISLELGGNAACIVDRDAVGERKTGHAFLLNSRIASSSHRLQFASNLIEARRYYQRFQPWLLMVPLDEALSRVVIDLSGRPGLVHAVDYGASSIGQFDTQLFHEFFQGFINHAAVTLHVDNIRGSNAHHIAETAFKAFGRALRMAIEMDPRMEGVMPSTKGTL